MKAEDLRTKTLDELADQPARVRHRLGAHPQRARAYAVATFGPRHIASRYLEMLAAHESPVLQYGTSG